MYIKERVRINVMHVSVYAYVASNCRAQIFFTTLLVWSLLIWATSLSHRFITYHIILLYSNQNVKKVVKHFCILHLLLNSHYISLYHIYKIQFLRLNWYSGGPLQHAVLLNSGHEYESMKLISLQTPVLSHRS